MNYYGYYFNVQMLFKKRSIYNRLQIKFISVLVDGFEVKLVDKDSNIISKVIDFIGVLCLNIV